MLLDKTRKKANVIITDTAPIENLAHIKYTRGKIRPNWTWPSTIMIVYTIVTLNNKNLVKFCKGRVFISLSLSLSLSHTHTHSPTNTLIQTHFLLSHLHTLTLSVSNTHHPPISLTLSSLPDSHGPSLTQIEAERVGTSQRGTNQTQQLGSRGRAGAINSFALGGAPQLAWKKSLKP